MAHSPTRPEPELDPDLQVIARIVAEHGALEGPLLPILHAVQAAFGHIPPKAHGVICEALGISKAELHGVISFYHDFRERPAGRRVVRICRAEACQAMGAAEMTAEVLARRGLDWHATSPDGAVTVEPVYCLGLCACAPAAMLDDRPVGRLDARRLEALLAEAGA